MTDPGKIGLNKEKLAALSRTKVKGSEVLSIADADSREAFLDAWTRTLSTHAKRMREKNLDLNAPFVVVQVEDCSIQSSNGAWGSRATLGAAPHDNYNGLLTIANSGVGGYVYNKALSTPEAFETALKHEGLDNRPTMMLATPNKLLIWPDGIAAMQKPLERELSDASVVINADSIDHQLGRFYDLIARQCTRWWQDSSLYITKEGPEGLVQIELWGFLICFFGDFARVKLEEKIGNGRSDITVWPHDTRAPNGSAVLELKTIRDCRTPKNKGAKTKPAKITEKMNLDWALAGVQQTASYRDTEKMSAAFLCVYDFRKKDCKLIDEKIEPTVKAYAVISRRFWIAASHNAHATKNYPIVAQSTS